MQSTKQALADSLKTLLNRKPLNRITVRDITDGCGVSRMTFYYHFRDIFDLLEWMLARDSARLHDLQQDSADWEEGLRLIVRNIYNSRVMISNISRRVSREQIERFLFSAVQTVIGKNADAKTEGLTIPEGVRGKVVRFYTYGVIGFLMDWVLADMPGDPDAMAAELCRLMRSTNARAMIERYGADDRK